MAKHNGRAQAAVIMSTDAVAKAIAASTPRELLAVAEAVRRRSPDHAAVLHDVLYHSAAGKPKNGKARKVPLRLRKAAGRALKARARSRAAARRSRQRS